MSLHHKTVIDENTPPIRPEQYSSHLKVKNAYTLSPPAKTSYNQALHTQGTHPGYHWLGYMVEVGQLEKY